MFTLTKNTVFTGDNAGLTSTAKVQTDGSDKRDIDLPADSADVEIDVDIKVAQCKGIVLLCDQDVTLKTNSSEEPTQTIELDAGRDLSWLDGQGENPFSADVTKLYATCTNAANLKIWNYSDATP